MAEALAHHWGMTMGKMSVRMWVREMEEMMDKMKDVTTASLKGISSVTLLDIMKV